MRGLARRAGHNLFRHALFGVLPVIAAAMSGCVVGQRPGQGTCMHLQEPETGAWYWLYLPEGYDTSRPSGRSAARHPLVVTFHGMKPFDDANRQIREWQQEADRYGFVVCAPELFVADLFGPLPLKRRDNPSLQRDEKNVIAIMDHVYRTTDVDPNKVLATSWSYGGYVAHYMVNRYPERFQCIAVKQSNFNADLLDPANVPRYRDRKVCIYYTEHDFAICRNESQQAAEWYARNGFDLTCGVFEKKGHERTPGVAAEFFARVCGIEAKSPPLELARMQIKLEHVGGTEEVAGRFVPGSDGPPSPRTGAAHRSRTHRRSAAPVEIAKAQRALSSRTGGRTGHPAVGRPNPDVPISGAATSGFPSNVTARGVPLRSRPVLPTPGNASGKRGVSPTVPARQGPVRVRVSSTIGVAPLLISYSAVIPKHLRNGAHLLWTADGQPLSNKMNGQKVFAEPGDHTLEVRVATSDGMAYRASRIINVIARAARRKQ